MTTPKHTPFNPFSLLKPTNQTGHSQQLAIMSKIKVVTSTLPKPLAPVHMVSSSAQHKAALWSFLMFLLLRLPNPIYHQVLLILLPESLSSLCCSSNPIATVLDKTPIISHLTPNFSVSGIFSGQSWHQSDLSKTQM